MPLASRLSGAQQAPGGGPPYPNSLQPGYPQQPPQAQSYQSPAPGGYAPPGSQQGYNRPVPPPPGQAYNPQQYGQPAYGQSSYGQPQAPPNNYGYVRFDYPRSCTFIYCQHGSGECLLIALNRASNSKAATAHPNLSSTALHHSSSNMAAHLNSNMAHHLNRTMAAVPPADSTASSPCLGPPILRAISAS